MHDPLHHLRTFAADDVNDQAAMLGGWDQCYTQLEAGPFEASIQAIGLTPNVGIFRKRTSRKLHKVFAPPAGSIAVAAYFTGSCPTLFQGEETEPGDVLVMPGGCEMELISRGNFDVVVAVFSRSHFQTGILSGRREPTRAHILKGGRGALVSDWLRASIEAVGSNDDRQPSSLINFSDDFLNRSYILASDDGAEWTLPKQHSALRIFSEARAFVEDCLERECFPTIPEIAAFAGVSPRSLEYAFHKIVGASPLRYLQYLRLCRARRDLRNDAELSVTSVATKWGFWHFGRFSNVYREMFGELPSKSGRDRDLLGAGSPIRRLSS